MFLLGFLRFLEWLFWFVFSESYYDKEQVKDTTRRKWNSSIFSIYLYHQIHPLMTFWECSTCNFMWKRGHTTNVRIYSITLCKSMLSKNLTLKQILQVVRPLPARYALGPKKQNKYNSLFIACISHVIWEFFVGKNCLWQT